MMGEELIIKTGELPFCIANILYQHLFFLWSDGFIFFFLFYFIFKLYIIVLVKKIEAVKIKNKWRPDMKIP